MPFSSRRRFIKQSAAVVSSLPFLKVLGFGESPAIRRGSSCYARGSNIALKESGTTVPNNLDVSIFSKHLQFLDYKETGAMAAELGFDGVDLTVRPKGHVLPKNVAVDLPKAVTDIRSAGSTCRMITTSIESVENQLDVDIIKTAGANGIEYYRTHWYKYPKGVPLPEAILQYQNQITELAKLNKRHNIIGCYQNHAGTKVGGSFWEIYKLIKNADPAYFGTQYDIRHATVDGGLSWTNGLKLLKDRIQVIVLKDFKWGKVGNEWKVISVPVGEGMVDFDKYFKLLKAYGLNPPVSLHLEYDLGGAEKGESEITVDRKVVFDAMRKDLVAVQKLWANA